MKTTSLRHKVKFQREAEARTGTGSLTKTWVDISSPDEWVQIIPLKGEERFMSAHLKTTVDHKIRMRYRDDVDNTMRVIHGLRVFLIDSIINQYERNRELQVMATEVFNV